MEQNPWGVKTEHFEAFKTQPLLPRSPSAILPRISEDGVIVSFPLCFLPPFHFLKHSRVPIPFVKIRASRNSTRRKRLLRVTRLRTFSLTKKSIVYSLESSRLRESGAWQRAVEKFEKVLKIHASLRIFYSTSSSFSRRNLCLSGDGSSVATVAAYRVRSRRRRVSWCCAALGRPRAPPASW